MKHADLTLATLLTYGQTLHPKNLKPWRTRQSKIVKPTISEKTCQAREYHTKKKAMRTDEKKSAAQSVKPNNIPTANRVTPVLEQDVIIHDLGKKPMFHSRGVDLNVEDLHPLPLRGQKSRPLNDFYKKKFNNFYRF